MGREKFFFTTISHIFLPPKINRRPIIITEPPATPPPPPSQAFISSSSMNLAFPFLALTLYIQASLAFHQSNKSKVTDPRINTRQNMAISDQLSRYQQRDPIPSENIFFIELGFGKIYEIDRTRPCPYFHVTVY